MAAGNPARLTTAKGRSFGLTVGGAFLAIAAFVWWRGHLKTAAVLGGLGFVLALAGLALPTRLGPIERAWMGLAHAISKVTTPIVMGIMYFLVIVPTALLRRALGGNPLEHREAGGSYWKPRPEGARRSGSMKRQF
jgi:hypothetical protein